MKKVKSILALLLAGSMALSMAACGDSGTTTTGSKETDSKPGESTPTEGTSKFDLSNLNEKGTLPVLKNKVPLTVLFGQDTNITDMETNAYTMMLEEKVNVDLSFEYLPAVDGKQKLSILISSGSKLPDIISYGLNPIETYTYGAQGYFQPLNELIDEIGYYSKEYFDSEEGKSVMQYINSPDGNIYGYPRICQEIGNDYDHRMWINKTWLDKLNLEVPKTTDEYYEVLKAFKEQDPNGNGKKDEIPLIGNKNGWNQNVWKSLLYAFVYVNDNFDYIIKGDDGKLQLSYMQPEWKKGLEYMNKLCTEGLLDPLTFTQDVNQFKQIIEDPNAQLIGSMYAGSMSVYQPASERKKDIISMAPLTGPDGVCWTSYRGTTIPDPFGFVTKDCSDPVAATALFDFMYEEEMSYSGRFGIKDVDWKTPGEGAVGLYENMGWKPSMEYITSIWGTAQNQHWGEVHPTLRTYAMSGGQVWNNDPFDSQYMTAQAVPLYEGKVPDDVVLRLIYTKEEADQIAEFKSTMVTYLEESVATFVTGTRPLSDWDTYIKEFEAMGTADFLAVAQQAYDRMQAMG